MSIDQEGFLSEEMAIIQKLTKDRYSHFFALLSQLNQFCQRTLLSLEINNLNRRQVLAATIFIKILEDLPSVVLLLERCALSPARSLLRVALEAVIKLANICQHDSFYKAYILAGEERRLKIFKAIKSSESPELVSIRPEFTEKVVADVQEIVEKLRSEGAKSSPLEQWASDVGMKGVYDGSFRFLSGEVHTSPDSLSKYLIANEYGELHSFNWGPGEERQLQGEFVETGRLLVVAMSSLNELFLLNVKSELDEFLKELNKLNYE